MQKGRVPGQRSVECAIKHYINEDAPSDSLIRNNLGKG